MKKIIIGVICSLVLTISGCIDSDDDDSPSKIGVLIDSPVANVTYQTDTQSGTTNANGEFLYVEGETVTFSIGNLVFPPVTASGHITPLTLAGSDTIDDQQATNIARLFQSLDEDGNPENGITIPANAASIATEINFDVDAATFENNSAVINLVTNSGSSNTSLVSIEQAQQHVTETLFQFGASAVIGSWTSSDGYNFLSLNSDNTFRYIESDPANSEPENGLESGTYSYDPNTGDITFNIIVDENSPGNDSGIGDTGTPVVIDSVLSNNNNTLTIADGAVVLHRSTHIGGWRSDDGYAELVLFENGDFQYEESDPANPAPQNGLESGTYTYNPASGEFTFTIGHDENDPGNDSGIGDIGTPAIIDAVFSNEGETLSIASGAVVLHRLYVVGEWRSGDGYNTLKLFDDDTFTYEESNPANPEPQNGLESGTYSYNSNTGNITFNITDDENDPGNDSGIGDTGTPAVIDVVLSSGNNTLTIADGAIVLNRGLNY